MMYNNVSRPCTDEERIVDIVLFPGGGGLELWLRPDCEGLLTPTITRHTKYMEFTESE